ncbi:MAG: UDP-glucose 4-epimerase GalE [Firmicutes bacterium]|nr:UDP-glucose 4-epimerase GalE [Bacillota bacterium]
MSSVLLTGGAGFIGSHTAVEFIKRGYDVVIADDLSNAEESVIDRIALITGKRPVFYKADVCDRAAVERIFDENDIDSVVHFAARKSVGESVNKPLMYYRVNLDSTVTLLEVMKEKGCKKFIFSSSACVYGDSSRVPFTEESPAGQCANPYGRTKHICEDILMDVSKADPGLSAVILRYFNPIGADESGLIGEGPRGIPTNLMPNLTRAAAGELEKIYVFGTDYPTPDGSGVRDYLHVTDLATGHIAALRYADSHTGCEVFNLGTGRGYSVLEVIESFERVNGLKLPVVLAERRPGDVAVSYADPSKAERLLGWKAEKSLDEMCESSWKWEKKARGLE